MLYLHVVSTASWKTIDHRKRFCESWGKAHTCIAPYALALSHFLNWNNMSAQCRHIVVSSVLHAWRRDISPYQCTF